MKSLAQRIALQFSFLLALLEIALAAHFIVVIGGESRKAKENEINESFNKIIFSIKSNSSIYVAERNLPYYISYTVYNAESKEIIASNAPFIPILPETEGEPREYEEKDYFTDGNLKVIYATEKIQIADDNFIIQVSNSIDRDEMANVFNFLNPKPLVFGIIPLLLISYLTSFLIAKRTLKPIVRMTKAAASISSSNLDALLAVGSKHDELDSLAHTFNELFRRLKQDFIAVNSANQAKTSFLSNMSHEIRTPINAVLGLDEMIIRESTEPQIQTYARDIQSSGKSLLSIVNDILDFSKIEAGKLDIIPVDYDLASTIVDLENMISTRAQKKRPEFHNQHRQDNATLSSR